MADRSAWSRRHPWLAGFEWSSMMTPLWGLIGLAKGAPLAVVAGVTALVFLAGWILFSLLLLRQFRQDPAEEAL
jgi:uncharacterized membrane protein YeiB